MPVAKGHIDQRMKAEADKVACGEKVEGRYLTYYLSQTGLPMKTVYSNVTELLLAGVDTVRTNPLSSSVAESVVSLHVFKPFCGLRGSRSPAQCPGPCMSCPVTLGCRPHCGTRC